MSFYPKEGDAASLNLAGLKYHFPRVEMCLTDHSDIFIADDILVEISPVTSTVPRIVLCSVEKGITSSPWTLCTGVIFVASYDRIESTTIPCVEK